MRLLRPLGLTTIALVATPCAAPSAVPVVVIDPGHGGHDSGAIGVDGTLEKDITLAIAKRIRAGLKARGIASAQLTRETDRFVSLDDRIRFTRRHRAALFFSIHADSAPGTIASGWTVYGLSDAASTIAAARFARRENAALAGPDGIRGDDTAALLADVVHSATSDAALRASTTLRERLTHMVLLRPNGLKRANFWVLKAAEVPSLLLETGYLSNADDLAYLRSDAGQAAIATAVVGAIERSIGRGRGLDGLGIGEPAVRRLPSLDPLGLR